MSVILLPQRWRNQPQGNVKLRPDWAGIVAAYVCGDRYFDGLNEGRLQPTAQQIFRPSVHGLAVGTIADSVPIALPIVNGPTFADWGFVFIGRKVTHTSTDGAAGFANSVGAYLEISTGSVSSDLRPVATGLTNHFSVSSLSGTPASGALVGSYSTALSTGFIYRDGDLLASGSHTYANNAPVLYLAIGGRYLSTNRNWRGNSELIAVLGQKQGQEIARDLSIDPWQMFASDPIRIYFDLGAGGAAFDAVPSAATVQDITSTGATPKCTITRTGSSPAGTLYYVIYPDGDGTPSDAQIIAGQDSTGSAATASGNEACRTTTGDQIFASPATGCAASTAYRIAFVASDGVTPSAVAVSASAFTTLAAGYETSVVPASVALTGGTISSAATANASTAVSAAAVAITGAAISSSATAHQAATVSPAAVALTGAAITSTASASQSSVVTPAVVALSGAGIQSQPTAHVATAVSPAGVTLASQVLGSDVSTATGAVVSPAVVAITGQAVASQVTQSDAVTAAAVVVTPAAIGSVVTAGVKTVVSPASVAVSGQLLGSDVFEHAVTQVTPASIVVAGALITSAYSGGPDPGPRGPASLNIAIRRASYRRFGKTWHAGGYWRLGWPSVRD